VRGHELTRRPADVAMHDREPFFWGAYVMAPWCNRLSTGPFRVGSRLVDLEANFNDGSAIHGQVYAEPWTQIGEADFEIERNGGRWPWPYRAGVRYAVDGNRVAITQRLRNLADEPMPGGIGLHPWFPTPVDVRINSALTYGSAKEHLAQPVAVSGDLDVRGRQPLADGVDATWADPGDPPLELWWTDGLHASLRAPFPTLHIVAACAPERGAIAAEAQTHAPQGLRRLLAGEPGAMTLIDPGAEIELPIEIEFDWAG
jgi:aldose 1-epimerase